MRKFLLLVVLVVAGYAGLTQYRQLSPVGGNATCVQSTDDAALARAIESRASGVQLQGQLQPRLPGRLRRSPISRPSPRLRSEIFVRDPGSEARSGQSPVSLTPMTFSRRAVLATLAALAVAAAREAALADDAGKALDAELQRHGAPARPVKAQPIRFVRKPKALTTPT